MTLLLAAQALAFEPTSSYERRDIEGWVVRVSADFHQRQALREEVLGLLRVRLFEINRLLPQPAVEQLRRDVAVWVELDDPRFPGMCFHPSADWLGANGYNPDKAGGIEIGNARNFLAWNDQPAMVLHELAHAYRHRMGRGDRAAVDAAYEEARQGGRYDRVLRAGGSRERAYALNSPTEFFAELTECYFLTNDFYPFVRAELKEHDQNAYDMIRRLWNRPPATTRAARRSE